MCRGCPNPVLLVGGRASAAAGCCGCPNPVLLVGAAAAAAVLGCPNPIIWLSRRGLVALISKSSIVSRLCWSLVLSAAGLSKSSIVSRLVGGAAKRGLLGLSKSSIVSRRAWAVAGCPNPVLLRKKKKKKGGKRAESLGCPNPVVLHSPLRMCSYCLMVLQSIQQVLEPPLKSQKEGKIIIEIGLCALSCAYEATTIL